VAEQPSVVLHVESSPQPSFAKPFSEPKPDHKSEPQNTEPPKTEPSHTESPKTELPKQTEPSKTESSKSDKTEHKPETKVDSKPDKADTNKDTHKTEPALPSIVKPNKYVYTRQELLDFRNVLRSSFCPF